MSYKLMMSLNLVRLQKDSLVTLIVIKVINTNSPINSRFIDFFFNFDPNLTFSEKNCKTSYL